MNNRSDIDRVLQAWMADGPAAIPDRVVAVVATRIGVQRQRRAWPFQGRTNVTTPIKLIASLAAAIVVAVVGYSLLPGVAGPGAPTTAPTPSIPTATPIASAPPTLVDGVLAGGTYRLRPFLTTTMTIDATVPEGGWVGGLPGALAGPRGESNAPNGIAIAFLEAQSIHSDPCHWDQDGNGFAPDEGDVEVGPTVDDLAEALAASSAYESTQAVDVTLGGFTGKRLELQLVPDPSGCDTFEAGEDQFFVFGGRDAGQFAQGGANTWQVTIVDVEGTRLIAVLLSYAETSAEDFTAAQGILDSLVIRP